MNFLEQMCSSEEIARWANRQEGKCCLRIPNVRTTEMEFWWWYWRRWKGHCWRNWKGEEIRVETKEKDLERKTCWNLLQNITKSFKNIWKIKRIAEIISAATLYMDCRKKEELWGKRIKTKEGYSTDKQFDYNAKEKGMEF